MTPREAYIALNMMEDMGPIRARALEEALGSITDVFTADESSLMRAKKVGPEMARKIVQQRSEMDPQEEIARAKKLGIHIVTPLDEEYPELLKAIHDPPLALYVMGTLETGDRHAIGVVGSRRCTNYGLAVADRLSYQLGKVGLVVVSGMARGIDTAAHKGALKGGGRTLAVLGGAIDKLYPPESRDLAAEIASQGALLSEYPLGKEPDRTTFPYRNRVIAGLSMGIVVVEADAKSGALYTADGALEEGRTVFAVPGRVDSPLSRGTHRLIKAGAHLVESVDDILREFEMLIPRETQKAAGTSGGLPKIHLEGKEQHIVEILMKGSLDVDSLARQRK